MNYLYTALLSLMIHSMAFAVLLYGTHNSSITKIIFSQNNRQLKENSYIPIIFSSAVDKEKVKITQENSTTFSDQSLSSQKKHSEKALKKTSPNKIKPLTKSHEVFKKDLDDLKPYPSNQLPSYPETAHQKENEGEVIALITVNEKGYVIKEELISSLSISEEEKQEILNTLKNWRFYRTQNSTIVLKVPISFKIED